MYGKNKRATATYETKGSKWETTNEKLKIVADTTSHVCLQIKFYIVLTKQILVNTDYKW